MDRETEKANFRGQAAEETMNLRSGNPVTMGSFERASAVGWKAPLPDYAERVRQGAMAGQAEDASVPQILAGVAARRPKDPDFELKSRDLVMHLQRIRSPFLKVVLDMYALCFPGEATDAVARSMGEPEKALRGVMLDFELLKQGMDKCARQTLSTAICVVMRRIEIIRGEL